MLGDMTRDQMDGLFRSEFFGRIGCHAEGQTYIVPIGFAYDGEYVYAHSADGMKIRALRANPRVCFQVDHVDNLANWRSAIAWGVYEELSGMDEAHARNKLADRFGPVTTSESSHPVSGPRTVGDADGDVQRAIFFRIRITERTGRFEKQ